MPLKRSVSKWKAIVSLDTDNTSFGSKSNLTIKPPPSVPIDTETGPGVYETALGYTEARRMADNAVLYKLLAKSVGIKYGIMPTFMAKPWANVSSSLEHSTSGTRRSND
jgi:hypothetical protein